MRGGPPPRRSWLVWATGHWRSLRPRAVELGCGEDELASLACTAYQGLAHLARSDVARSYLAPYFAACD